MTSRAASHPSWGGFRSHAARGTEADTTPADDPPQWFAKDDIPRIDDLNRLTSRLGFQPAQSSESDRQPTGLAATRFFLVCPLTA
jgi:hypothetical protein